MGWWKLDYSEGYKSTTEGGEPLRLICAFTVPKVHIL